MIPMVKPGEEIEFRVSTFPVSCQLWHGGTPLGALFRLEYADIVLLIPQAKEKKPKGRGMALDSPQELDQH